MRVGEKATAKRAIKARAGAKVAPVIGFRAASLSAQRYQRFLCACATCTVAAR